MNQRLCCASFRFGAAVVLPALFASAVPLCAKSADKFEFLKPVSAAEARYVGPGSCSATACHGSVRALTQTKVLQNEYSTWVLQDKHARAWNVLNNQVSQRIAR